MIKKADAVIIWELNVNHWHWAGKLKIFEPQFFKIKVKKEKEIEW
jgi:hypothetical protein